MSRVRIEIWDNNGDVRSAEVEHAESRIAYERAASMAEATLPPADAEAKPTGPKLNAGSYFFEMKNVRVDPQTLNLLTGKIDPGFNVKVVADQSPRKPCGEKCQDDDGPCTDTCARPQGHDDWHVTADGACTWGPEEGEGSAQLCLNEIGAPSATRNCQKPLNHDGLCDGEQDYLMETLNG